MEFTAWFRQWVSGHPLKEPPAFDRARYIAEVMERVKALGEPTPALRPAGRWWAWPRLALATAAVAAALLVVARVQSPGPGPGPVPASMTGGAGTPLAQEISDDAQVLAALDEPLPLASGATDDAEELAQELAAMDMDALLLAEAPPSDDAWIEQTLTLLEQLEEDLPEGAADDPSGDEWLDELQWLDEHDLAASS